jgi:hypothetical protein
VIAFLLSIILFSVPAWAQESGQAVDIITAVDQGLVDVSVEASGDSYYGPGTLVMNATNLTGEPLTLHIPRGLRFRSQNTNYQDEIIAVDTYVDLDSGETVTESLTSFCGNAHRAAPAPNTPYEIGEMEDRQMQNLLEEIEEEGLQDDMEGQWAVWNLTDDMPAIPDFTEILEALDSMGSDGVIRDVAESAPSIAGPLVRNLLRSALLMTFWWLIPLVIALLLLLLLLWWLLRKRPAPGPVSAPGRREEYRRERKPKTKKPDDKGADITHGRPRRPPQRKS